ncbi:unnamed protein product [Tuber melanosporum]|uniref:(Perigord truffle) hypothetical protein n=1 Tax=Tuber melanosporum (strain Mel28) TaxID=656061 RepID=D5GA14_TUBMM|nr:uncharacterized protein GSTUM_00003491001 [Tuber melanosporum]CAZ81357.1 unnamed protein product [Tuber melanosporum]
MDYELLNAQGWDDDDTPPPREPPRAPRATKRRGAKSKPETRQPIPDLVSLPADTSSHSPHSVNDGIQHTDSSDRPASNRTASKPQGKHLPRDSRYYTDPKNASGLDSKHKGQHSQSNAPPSSERSLVMKNNKGHEGGYYKGDGPAVVGQSMFGVPALSNVFQDQNGVVEGRVPGPAEFVAGLDGFVRDSTNDKRARDGVPADDYMSLPIRRPTQFDESFFGLRNNHLAYIAIKTNTHLSVPESSDDPRIGIWGTKEQVEAAKHDLNALMQHIMHELETETRRAGGNWEKVKAAPSERKQKWLDRQTHDTMLRKRYRQQPPTDKPLPFNGVFVWPTKEIDPQQPLGTSFEALDDLRYENRVYITMSRAEGIFHVAGEEEALVNAALERMFGVFCEVAGRNRKPNRKMLVHPPSPNPRGATVKLITEHGFKDRQVTIKRLKTNLGPMVRLSAIPPKAEWLEMWKTKRAKLERANYIYLKKVVQQGLSDLLYYRGHSTMKVHFGSMMLFSYKAPECEEFELLEFCEMAKNPQAAGELIRHIGGENVAKELIHECFVRHDLFQPTNTSDFMFRDNAYDTTIPNGASTGLHLHETNMEPVYHATLICRTYDDKKCTNDLRLDVKFEKIPGVHPIGVANSAGNLYKVGTRTWIQLAPGAGGPIRAGDHSTKQKGPFDLKVMDLENDLAWQFQLLTHSLTRDIDVYPIFSEFVRKIRIEEIPDVLDPVGPPVGGAPDRRRLVPRVSYVNLPGMTVEALTLKTKYQFWIKGTTYQFDITKYEYFDTDEIRSAYPDGVQNSWNGLRTIPDTRWGASFSNPEWVTTMAHQRELGIGLRGSWNPDVSSFFKSSKVGGFEHPDFTRTGAFHADPWKGDGFKECITRIQELVRFIADIRTKVEKKEAERIAKTNFAGCEEFDD